MKNQIVCKNGCCKFGKKGKRWCAQGEKINYENALRQGKSMKMKKTKKAPKKKTTQKKKKAVKKPKKNIKKDEK